MKVVYRRRQPSDGLLTLKVSFSVNHQLIDGSKLSG